jgi:hypothetical protein
LVDIFNEVEEDLRREQYLRLWRRYGMWLAAAAALVVFGTAGVSIWRGWHADKLATASDAFAVAAGLEAEGKLKEAADAFALVGDSAPGGYPMLARLRQAAALATSGDAASAVSVLDGIAAGGGDAALRELAGLKAAFILVDTATPEDMAKRLAPLAAEGRPWRFSARELQALSALKQGQKDEARTILSALSDDQAAPEGLRSRASELLAAIGKPAAAQTPAPAPSPAP